MRRAYYFWFSESKMANRRPQNNSSGRRMDFQRNDRGKNFGRSGVSPWQGGGPGGGLPNLLPLSGGSTEATLALASNIINLLQPRQNPVPSLLDMPIRRDFGPSMGRYDRGYGPSRVSTRYTQILSQITVWSDNNLNFTVTLTCPSRFLCLVLWILSQLYRECLIIFQCK